MEMQFVRDRITQLRKSRGISEYKLSNDLGHSKNYIHNIVTGHSQPSLKELFCIVEQLGVTMRDFFDEKQEYRNPLLALQIMDGIRFMADEDLEALALLVDRLNQREG